MEPEQFGFCFVTTCVFLLVYFFFGLYRADLMPFVSWTFPTMSLVAERKTVTNLLDTK